MASPLSIQIDDSLKARFERAAIAEGRPVSEMAREAIEDFVSTRERRLAGIMAAYEASLTEKAFISGDRMTAWVESWDTDNELPEPTPDILRG